MIIASKYRKIIFATEPFCRAIFYDSIKSLPDSILIEVLFGYTFPKESFRRKVLEKIGKQVQTLSYETKIIKSLSEKSIITCCKR